MPHAHVNSDLEITEKICEWLSKQHQVTLFTVIQTWGSSPRPTGSLLAVNNTGEFIGSVSGGCVDDDLLVRVKRGDFLNKPAHFILYGDTETNRFGLPCGGIIKLLTETSLSLTQFTIILGKLKDRQRIGRRVCLNTGETSLHSAYHSNFSAQTQDVMRNFGPAWRLFIIGAGELSQRVCQIATLLDYHITVCDPRDTYRHNWSLHNIEINPLMPDDVINTNNIDENSVVLALSHDPKLDDMALMYALGKPAFYVGALGSKRNNQLRRERLLQLGLNAEQVKKLHGPVGLDIGSHTPSEIALSILADITARRNGKNLTGTS